MHSLRLASVVFAVSIASAVAAAETPEYERDVAPLLTKYCAGCHNDADREGKFSLETFASLQEGTPDGPALLSGDAASSKLIQVLTGATEPSMPPEGEPRPTDDEIAILKA